MKILISAYACEPYKGSEPGVGWNWVKQISRFHEIWVVTRANNREIIEKAVINERLQNISWIYYDLPKWLSFWKKGQKGLQIYYYLWQIGIYFHCKKWHKKISFDIIHHITFGKYWVPSFLSFLPAKFILGPVGGGESTPKQFWKDFSLRGKIFEVNRNLIRFLVQFDFFTRYSIKKSSIVIATTEATACRIKSIKKNNIIVHPQLGIYKENINYFERLNVKKNNTFILISIGRLLHWKGFHLSMRAFAKMQSLYPNSQYWIINDGPEMNFLKEMAIHLNIMEKVKFWGKLPTLDDVYIKLAQSHVLVHPALHEAFGNVVLEAMASGKPVICLDLGGPAIQVTEKTGFKIAAKDPLQVIEDMAEAMLKLASDAKLREEMGKAAKERALEHFSWDKKGNFINDIYQKIVN